MAKKKRPRLTTAGKKKNQAPKPRRGAKGPKQPAFPGMSQVRSATLDRLCESIGNAREEKNRLTTEEAGDGQAAMKYMIAKNIRAYVHMGVRLTLKVGVDKLGITLVKDKTEQGADLGTGAPPAGEEAAGDSGGDATDNDGQA
jgi:hypothetical protein